MKINVEEKNKLSEIQDFYDSVYYKKPIVNTHISRHYTNLIKKINIQSGQNVLDVGCGKGGWLFSVQQKGARPAGVDLSRKAIESCQSVMPDGEFHAVPAEVLPFENDRFDLICCLGSLEHFVKPKQSLEEMVRVAKENANFLILVPNSGFLTRQLGLYKGTFQVAAKEEVLSLSAWSDLFNSAGLKVNDKWKDLHVLSWSWIMQGKWYKAPVRATQALLLTIWPLKWQYQVYFLCSKI